MTRPDKYTKNLVSRITKIPAGVNRDIKYNKDLFGENAKIYKMGEIEIIVGKSNGLFICEAYHPTRLPNLDELFRIRRELLPKDKMMVTFLELFPKEDNSGDYTIMRIVELDMASMYNYLSISNRISKFMYETLYKISDTRMLSPEILESGIPEAIKLYETYIKPFADEINEEEKEE